MLSFPNKEADFGLPDSDYNDLMSKDFPRYSSVITKEDTKSDGKTESAKESQGIET